MQGHPHPTNFFHRLFHTHFAHNIRHRLPSLPQHIKPHLPPRAKLRLRATLLVFLSLLLITQPALALNTDLFTQNYIIGYDPDEDLCNTSTASTSTSSTITATGDIAAITSAKNADQQFENEKWSDKDTASIKAFLEKYGDLAYQTGNAVGVPWTAIIVQMRYENASCGKNNIFGMGCYSDGTPFVGNNVGEAFVKYTEFITNGSHNQALGISDPKEFLVKLGPTWVNGDVNASGYAEIESMKKSVDALQNFINSSEGQAIVSTFTNYSKNNTSSTSSSSSGSSSSGAYSKLKETIKEYYQIALDSQKEFGTPWEVVFAQMQYESQVGQDPNSIANRGATNNYLGIRGSGDTGASWTNPNTGKKWAIFSSVGASIPFWAGSRVLRNGYYDAAFQYLDPENYNLHAFLTTMISTYAPSSDGNNEAAYVSNVERIIQGPIAEVREELGLPNSEEYAKQEVIPIGGNTPLGSSGSLAVNLDTSSSATQNDICLSTSSGGLTAGGLTKEAAKQLMDEYFSTPESDFAKYNINSGFDCDGGALSNCVSFVKYFLAKYTTQKNITSTGNGGQVVKTLINQYGFTDGGTVPRAYAIFSTSSGATRDSNGVLYGHTGVVLNVDEANGKILIGEAGCTGTRIDGVNEYDLSRFTSGAYTFAYTDNFLDPNSGLPVNNTSFGEVVVYNQFDPRWKDIRYGNNSGCTTIGQAGCGPSSLASVITLLTGQSVTPDVIAKTAATKGYRSCPPNVGSLHSISLIAEDYGLKVTHISNSDWNVNTINSYLKSGGVIHISRHGSNPFTSGGHFIAIYELTSSGKWRIIDSNGTKGQNNSNIEWDPQTIISAATNTGDAYVISK